MPVLITGSRGILGGAIHKRIPSAYATTRKTLNLSHQVTPEFSTFDTAYLCAGTKGHKECEGNAEVFRADVDGNIRLIRHLLKQGCFVVFVSTDAVEWGTTSYTRNRLLVEQALWFQPHTAVIRPSRFTEMNVAALADLCVDVGTARKEGVHYWGSR